MNIEKKEEIKNTNEEDFIILSKKQIDDTSCKKVELS